MKRVEIQYKSKKIKLVGLLLPNVRAVAVVAAVAAVVGVDVPQEVREVEPAREWVAAPAPWWHWVAQ